MSLTITAGSFDGVAFGQLANYSINVTSTEDLSTKDIYFIYGGFVKTNTPKPVFTEVPEEAYISSSFAALFSPLVTLNDTQHIPSPGLTVNTNFDIDIDGKLFMQADRNNIFDARVFDNSLVQLKNNIDSPNILDNSYPSVYNENRYLRLIVLSDNGCGVLDSDCIDILVTARFCDSGLLGAASEYDISYRLERDGQTVTDFSLFDPTKIIITLDTNGNPFDTEPELLIYRENNVTNNLNFVFDTDALYFIGNTPQIGTHSLISYQPFTLVSGTIYEAIYELDNSYFERASSYRVLPIAKDGLGLYNSSCTAFARRSTGLPLPITGTMVGTLSDYNLEYLNNCMTAAPLERIKSCVTVDKVNYNFLLNNENLGVDFDTNIDSVQIILSSFLGGEIINFTDRSIVEGFEIIDNPNDYTSCYEFRIPESAANDIIEVKHIFLYNVLDPLGNPYQDKVTFKQFIQVQPLDSDGHPNAVIDTVIFKDSLGNVIDELCDDYKDQITVEVTKFPTGLDYNLIALIVEDTTTNFNEEESYNNNVLDQLVNNVISSVSVQFVANLATFEIDPTLLLPDTKYNVYAIAKEVKVPSSQCAIIDLFTEIETTVINPAGGGFLVDFDMNFLVTNYSPATVNNLDIVFMPGTAEENTYNFTADNGTFSEVLQINVPPRNVTIEATITLSNGCTYTDHEVVLPLMPIVPYNVGKTDSITADV